MTQTDSKPVTLINVFEVAAKDVADFVAGWQRRVAIMATKKGFLSARLHRAAEPDARFQLVNVAEWSSRADFERAVADSEFQQSHGQSATTARANPALYHVVVDTVTSTTGADALVTAT